MEKMQRELSKNLLVVLILLLFLFGGILGLDIYSSQVNDMTEDNVSNIKEWAISQPQYGSWERKKSEANPIRYKLNGNFFSNEVSEQTGMARIMCAGDLMCEPAMSQAYYYNNKFFYEPCFASIKKVFEKSDFAIANLETSVAEDYPYAIDIHKLEDRYHCNAPKEYLDALRYAGFDAFTLANNHTCDTGVYGLQKTISNLDEKGFLHTGAFTSPNEDRFLIVDINGIKVGFLSYTEHFNSNLDEKCFSDYGRKVMLNKYSKDKVERDILDARRGGAEFILVYIHFWCKDYTHEVSDSQIKCAQEIVEAGADCIVGGHPHAVQKYDRLVDSKGKSVPVNFCLGNFITSDGNMITRYSYIYELFLEKDLEGVKISDEKIIPCRVVEQFEKGGYVVYPTPKAWRGGSDSDLLINAENDICQWAGGKLDIDNNE